MCRLFAWHSNEPVSASAVLGSDFQAFTELSTVHRDGWGVAYTGGQKISAVRDTSPAYLSDLYSVIIRSTPLSDAIVHLRWATEDFSVCVPNTHPFIKKGPNGEVAFCHNGGISKSAELISLIDSDLFAELEGETDSEQYCAALISQLRKSDGDFVSAYKKLVSDLEQISYTSLNALILTAKELVIVCQHKPEKLSLELDSSYYNLYWQSAKGLTSAWSSGVRQKPTDAHELVNGTMLYISIDTGEFSTHEIR